jgi:hypothetical protein
MWLNQHMFHHLQEWPLFSIQHDLQIFPPGLDFAQELKFTGFLHFPQAI